MMASPKLCDEAALSELVAALESGAKDDLERTDRLIAQYPDDGRLHLLRASMLMEIGRSIEALPAFRKAVELAPDFALARFQLGFFLLTSGDAAEALSVWGPLALFPADHYLRLFVGGLTYLIRDEFTDSVRLLREGIAANEENLPLNRDIALIIEQVEHLGALPSSPGTGEEVSATSVLLGQFAPRRIH